MTWFRYVPLAQVAAYLVKGWRISCDMADTHHGKWSVLMEWPHETEPPK